MDFMPDFKPSSTISVFPPGGTGHHHHAPHHPGGPHPGVDLHFATATAAGFKALWIVFYIFSFGFILSSLLALRVERKARLFHWLTATVLGIAAISYLAMATGQGVSLVGTHYSGKSSGEHELFRQVYYARYLDWLFTTPLLLVSLAFLAGLSPADTVLTILFDIGMIVTGLIGGLTPARFHSGEVARWTFFAISCAFYIGIIYVLTTGGVKAAGLRPRKTRGLFYLLGSLTGVLWTAYPIIFALTEGANLISVNAEIISYAILDVSAKFVFGFAILLLHSHGGEDDYTMPDWFVEPRSGGADGGRGGYGAIRVGDD